MNIPIFHNTDVLLLMRSLPISGYLDTFLEQFSPSLASYDDRIPYADRFHLHAHRERVDLQKHALRVQWQPSLGLRESAFLMWNTVMEYEVVPIQISFYLLDQ